MNTKPLAKHLLAISRYLTSGLTLIVALGLCGRAQAAFHFWSISQIYSNSSGSLQFIEMFTTVGGQQFVNGTSITVNNSANTLHNPFTVPSSPDYSSIDSAGHFLLFGTAGLHAAGGPVPDFIIPNNFLFTAGGSIDFFGTSGNSGLSYPALPTDGIHSLPVNGFSVGSSAFNFAHNYSGQTGQVVPEPAAITLAAIGGICASCFLRRRRS